MSTDLGPIGYQRSDEHEKLLQSLNVVGKSSKLGHVFVAMKGVAYSITTGKASLSMQESLQYIKDFSRKIGEDSDEATKLKEALSHDPKLKKAIEKVDAKIAQAAAELASNEKISGHKSNLFVLSGVYDETAKFSTLSQAAREAPEFKIDEQPRDSVDVEIDRLVAETGGKTPTIGRAAAGKMRELKRTLSEKAGEYGPAVGQLRQQVSGLFDRAVSSAKLQTPAERETAKLKQEMLSVATEMNTQTTDKAQKVCSLWGAYITEGAITNGVGSDIWRNAPKTTWIVNGEEQKPPKLENQTEAEAARGQTFERFRELSGDSFDAPDKQLMQDNTANSHLGDWVKNNESSFNDKAKRLMKSCGQSIYSGMLPQEFMGLTKHSGRDTYIKFNNPDNFIREIRSDGTSVFTIKLQVSLYSNTYKPKDELDSITGKMESKPLGAVPLSIVIEYDENMKPNSVSFKTEDLAFNETEINSAIDNKLSQKK